MKRGDLRSRVRKALDAGVGVYNRTWPLGQARPRRNTPHSAEAGRPRVEKGGVGPGQAELRTLTAQVLDWCRFAMGQMRKPYGLDYVSLVIAVMGADDEELAQVNLGVLRPQEFYGDEGVARQVEEALARWEREGLLSAGEGACTRRLTTLLFSWGDLTRELMLAG